MSGYTAGQICAVYNCNNYSWQNNSRSFFRFPRDRDICLKWILKARRGDLYEKFKKHGPEKLNISSRICAAHFKKEDFRNSNLTSQGLKKGSVPSLHLPICKNVNNKKINLEYDTPSSGSEAASIDGDNDDELGVVLDSRISNLDRRKLKYEDTLLNRKLFAYEKEITELKQTISELQRENSFLRQENIKNKRKQSSQENKGSAVKRKQKKR